MIMCFSGVVLIKSKMTEQTLLMQNMSNMWKSSSLRQGNRQKSTVWIFDLKSIPQNYTCKILKNVSMSIYLSKTVSASYISIDWMKRSSFYKRLVFSNTLANTMGHFWKYVLPVYFMDKATHMCGCKLWVKSKHHI